ncbi:MAG: hypothetical protein ABR874_02190 [Candidatus Sulfotelmatobacter sp.]|jgi:hypothetical protein
MKYAEQVKTTEEKSTRRSAGEWFLDSGIQEANGGVARYYFSDCERNAPLSTEITGYTVSALVNLYKQTSEARYMDAAIEAGCYLVRAWDEKCSAMPFECDGRQKYSFFFDNGIIVRGLLSLWREFKKEEFLETAVRVGDSMVRDFANEADFVPIIEMPAKTQLPRDPTRWSRSSACYQLKAALGWYELWQTTNDDRYLQCYRQMLDSSLENHSSFLPGVDSEFLVMDRLHAYCYFLEGLLPVAGDPAAAEAMVSGIDRVADFVRAIGPKFLRSDVVAQSFRVRLFADQFGINSLDQEAARNDVAVMRSFQSDDADLRLNGGFWFGTKNGEMLAFMNPVSTAFCNQALEMWSRRGERRFEWRALV